MPSVSVTSSLHQPDLLPMPVASASSSSTSSVQARMTSSSSCVSCTTTVSASIRVSRVLVEVDSLAGGLEDRRDAGLREGEAEVRVEGAEERAGEVVEATESGMTEGERLGAAGGRPRGVLLREACISVTTLPRGS